MSFKLKLCRFVSVASLFKKGINNAFDSFGIEWLAVTVLSVDVCYGNALIYFGLKEFCAGSLDFMKGRVVS